jgi:hypothetical protein
MTLEHNNMVWKSDSLRLKSDIRNRPEKELASYQKTQLRQIRRQIGEYREIELAHAIRRTVDGTLLEELNMSEHDSSLIEVLE